MNEVKFYENFLNELAESLSWTKEPSIDILECFIDKLIEDDSIYESIPFARTMIGIIKTGINIRERKLFKNTCEFIKAFNNNDLTKKDIDDYKIKLLSDPKKLDKELGRVVILIDRHVDSIKSSILGNLYASFIGNYIDWSRFCELSDVLDSVLLYDLKYLLNAYNIDKPYKGGINENRLLSLGLLTSNNPMIVMDMDEWNPSVNINDFGKEFIKFGINDKILHDINNI